MGVLILLVPLALLLALFFVASFLWGVKKGQFDDLESPKHRILTEED